MVGFRKGALGSPFSTEYYTNEGMDLGRGGDRTTMPKIGPGAEGRRVTMEVSRDSGLKSDRKTFGKERRRSR